MLVAVALLAGSPAHAQSGVQAQAHDSRSSPSFQQESGGAPSSFGEPPSGNGVSRREAQDLPDWAEPSSGEGLGGQEAQTYSEEEIGANAMAPPGDPSRTVPLGGLEWLVAAGFGYGLYRLRRRDES